MAAAPRIKLPVSPDSIGASPGSGVGVIVGGGSVLCSAPTCEGKLNPVNRTNPVSIAVMIIARVICGMDLMKVKS